MNSEQDNHEEGYENTTNPDPNTLDIAYFSFTKQDGYIFVSKKSRWKEKVQDSSIIKIEDISGVVFESHRLMSKLLIPLILLGIAITVCTVIRINWKILLNKEELELDTILWDDVTVALITLWFLFTVIFLVGFARNDYYSLRFGGGGLKLYDLSIQQHSNLCKFLTFPEPPKDTKSITKGAMASKVQRVMTSKAPWEPDE